MKEENGLVRKTYSGEYDSCSQMKNESSTEENIVYDFNIDSNKKDNFGYIFSGYIEIDYPGTYEFQTISDDGSRLFINSKLIVDNDGLHSKKAKVGLIKLDQKRYKIVVEYFERGGQETLEVSWRGQGFEWSTIPAFRLFQSD